MSGPPATAALGVAALALAAALTVPVASVTAADPGNGDGLSPVGPGPETQPGDRPDSCDDVAEPVEPGEYEGTIEGDDRDYFQVAVDAGDRVAVSVTVSPEAGRPEAAVEQFESIVSLRRGPNALSAGDLVVRPGDTAEPVRFTLVGERTGVVCFVIRNARPADAAGAWNWTVRLRPAPTRTPVTASPTPTSATPTPTGSPTATTAATTTTTTTATDTEAITLAPRNGTADRATPGFGPGVALAALVAVVALAVVRRRS